MKKEFLPVTIMGEDVIVDYVNKELIYPNLQDDPEKDLPKLKNITSYLDEEGFLEFDHADAVIPPSEIQS